MEEGKRWAVCLFCHTEGNIDDMIYHYGSCENGIAHEDCSEAADEMCIMCGRGTKNDGQLDCDRSQTECFQTSVEDGKINLSSLIARNEIRKECDVIKEFD